MTKTHDEHRGGYLRDQRTFFDRLITDDWDTYLDPRWNRSRQAEVDAIFSIVGENVRSVIDLGCGSGYQDRLMAQRTSVESVVGIDYSSKSIEKAEQNYSHPKVQRRAADFFSPEFVDAYRKKFDLVVSFQVIEHLESGETFFDLNQQLVRPKGFVAMVTPNRLRLQNRFRSIIGRTVATVDPLHFREYTVSELAGMASSRNLELIGGFGRGFSFSIKGFRLLQSSSLRSIDSRPTSSSWADEIGVVFRSRA